MIEVTEKAKEKAIELMSDDGFDASKDYIRVGVKSGGCSGLSYELSLTTIKMKEIKYLKTIILS